MEYPETWLLLSVVASGVIWLTACSGIPNSILAALLALSFHLIHSLILAFICSGLAFAISWLADAVELYRIINFAIVYLLSSGREFRQATHNMPPGRAALFASERLTWRNSAARPPVDFCN